MNGSRAQQARVFDALCVVVAGTISIYLIGGATAFGIDYFMPLLAAFMVMFALLGRDLFLRQLKTPLSQATHPLAIGLGLFALALVLSSALVQLSGLRNDVSDTYRQVGMLLAGMTPFLLGYRVTRRQGSTKIIVWMAHVVMAICTLSIGLEVTGITNIERYGDRYFGFLSDPVALLITFPIIFYAATQMRFLLILSLLLLFFTVSRGPIALAFSGILLIAAFRRGRARLQTLILSGIGLLITLVMSNYVSALSQRFMEIDLDDSRFKTPMAGLKLFAESPFFGNGYGALGYYYPINDNVVAHVYGRYRDGVLPIASSTWIQMLSDGGVLLAIPYFVLIVLTARYCLPFIRGWLSMPCTRPVAGASVWLVVVFYINHSSGWFLAGGFVLPLIMALLGIVAGTKAYERQS